VEGRKEKTTKEKGVMKIVTILFMSHRIQAKIFDTDTFQSFLGRIRLILPNIDSQRLIGLYHLFFIKEDEEEFCSPDLEGTRMS
jgi:hypothetical protein